MSRTTGVAPSPPGDAVFEGSLDAIVTMDQDGKVSAWNPAAEKLFGWSRSEAIGQAVADLIVPPGYRQAHIQGIRKLRETGEGPVLGQVLDSLTAMNRAGREFPIEIRISKASVGENGTFMAFLRDITDRKAQELNLRAARDASEAASQAKSEFLSRVSHELRTPLTAILGFAELGLVDDGSGEEQHRERFQIIVKAGEHLLSLIDEVLDIASIEERRASLSLEPIHVAPLLQETVVLVLSSARTQGITVPGTFPDASGIYVRGDRHRLKQVLLNLLSNAVKYNREGGSVAITVSTQDAGRLRIAVEDTGHGIGESDLDRLFVPFERLGAERTTIAGTGLGLALSKGLIEAMGGFIGVESTPGTGSCFWIELPTARP